jgi:Phosphotransferase enzyme family
MDDDADGGRRGPRPRLTTGLIRRVRQRYGVPEPADLTDLGGSAHLSLLWVGGGRRVVVRVYRAHVTAARLEAIQFARGILHSGHVPTARIIESRAGTPFVTSGSNLVEVEEFVESDAIMDSWDRLATGMPLLGRVHSVLASGPAEDVNWEPRFANYISAHDALPGTTRGAARIRSWQPTAAERAVADAAEELAGSLRDAEAQFARCLPAQLVHGDFWHNNVRFLRGEPVLVADLDFMGCRTRVDDLALTLHFALCEMPDDERGTEGPDRVAGLVRAYEAGLDDRLSAAERGALPLVIARQPLWSVGGWVARLDDDTAARRHAAICGPEIGNALAILANLGRWQDALR